MQPGDAADAIAARLNVRSRLSCEATQPSRQPAACRRSSRTGKRSAARDAVARQLQPPTQSPTSNRNRRQARCRADNRYDARVMLHAADRPAADATGRCAESLGCNRGVRHRAAAMETNMNRFFKSRPAVCGRGIVAGPHHRFEHRRPLAERAAARLGDARHRQVRHRDRPGR